MQATRAVQASLLRNATPFYYSTRGNGTCLNMTHVREQAAVQSPGWNFLACTEIVHPIGANNVTYFFPPDTWSVASTAAWCKSMYAVDTIRPRWIPTEFGLYDLAAFTRAHSKIVFTYGLRDPWHVFAISLVNLSDALPVVTAPDGSHCADMAGSSEADTPTMRHARAKAEAIVTQWIGQAQAERALS